MPVNYFVELLLVQNAKVARVTCCKNERSLMNQLKLEMCPQEMDAPAKYAMFV